MECRHPQCLPLPSCLQKRLEPLVSEVWGVLAGKPACFLLSYPSAGRSGSTVSLHWVRYQLCSVSQSHLTLCDPMDCSPPGSSVLGIFQARILEWVAISYSRRYQLSICFSLSKILCTPLNCHRCISHSVSSWVCTFFIPLLWFSETSARGRERHRYDWDRVMLQEKCIHAALRAASKAQNMQTWPSLLHTLKRFQSLAGVNWVKRRQDYFWKGEQGVWKLWAQKKIWS